MAVGSLFILELSHVGVFEHLPCQFDHPIACRFDLWVLDYVKKQVGMGRDALFRREFRCMRDDLQCVPEDKLRVLCHAQFLKARVLLAENESVSGGVRLG